MSDESVRRVGCLTNFIVILGVGIVAFFGGGMSHALGSLWGLIGLVLSGIFGWKLGGTIFTGILSAYGAYNPGDMLYGVAFLVMAIID